MKREEIINNFEQFMIEENYTEVMNNGFERAIFKIRGIDWLRFKNDLRKVLRR